jgi:hypothetical protein
VDGAPSKRPAAAPVVKRDPKGRLLPGAKLREATTLQDVRRLVGEATRDGQDIVEFMARTLNGHTEGATVRDRYAAGTFLADRLWGKAVERIAVADVTGTPEALASMTPEQLEWLARLPTTGAPPGIAQLPAQDAARQELKQLEVGAEDAEIIEEDS